MKDNLDRKIRDESVNCISKKPSYDQNIIYATNYSSVCILTNETNFVQQTVK